MADKKAKTAEKGGAAQNKHSCPTCGSESRVHYFTGFGPKGYFWAAIILHALLAVACTAPLLGAPSLALAQTPPQAQSQVMTTTSPAPTAAPMIPNDQLDSLVAPIALYPDPLLAQTLAASTYPLEVIQLQQWMGRNKDLKDKALVDAIANQPWEPSVQSMAAYPDALERMATNIQWTTELGNAFLSQQSDVMAAVQRMRMKAQGKGTLKTDWHQKVETQTVDDGKEVVLLFRWFVRPC
jgi:hypothetical protein